MTKYRKYNIQNKQITETNNADIKQYNTDNKTNRKKNCKYRKQKIQNETNTTIINVSQIRLLQFCNVFVTVLNLTEL